MHKHKHRKHHKDVTSYNYIYIHQQSYYRLHISPDMTTIGWALKKQLFIYLYIITWHTCHVDTPYAKTSGRTVLLYPGRRGWFAVVSR